MSQQLLDARHRADVALHTVLNDLSERSVRVSLSDRLSLRIGVWLLLRGARRVETHTDRVAHTLRRDAERAREAREIAAARAWHQHSLV